MRGLEAGNSGVALGKRLGIPVEQCFLTEHNARAVVGKPKVLSFFEVLEHIEDPAALLRAATGHLDSDTALVIEVPRYPSLSAFSIQCFPELDTRHFIPPDHIHIFTEQSMEFMLESAGFIMSHIWTFGQDFYEMLSMMTMKADKEISMWPEALFEAVNGIQQKIDECGLSDTMLVVAYKSHP